MYCLKCRKVTSTSRETHKFTKNNRKMLQGICSVCGTKKSKFIGSGMFNKALTTASNLFGEMHLPSTQGEFVPGGSFNHQKKYSYCGPGTKYNQRVQEGYEGINELDRNCKLHDKFYTDHLDTKSRNISDYALAQKANDIAKNENYDTDQRWKAGIVSKILAAKARFGLGVKSKNS